MPKKSAADKKTGARNRRSRASTRPGDTSQHNRRPKSINDLLQLRPGFQRITATLASQQSWVDWLRATVAGELAEHIVNAVPHEAELVVFADSPAWGARLRYAMAALQSQIAARDSAISHTSVRVQMRGLAAAP